MQINYSGAMIGVVVIALAVVILARGRRNGRGWLVVVGAVLAHQGRREHGAAVPPSRTACGTESGPPQTEPSADSPTA
ncbi:hypothetical protein AB0I98_06865 [Streptomyces sp. NPDC050211]|uniref:hypothetical protein n=1 Tax=Streptomyces sp. NPDC050211 TaxID=3154932 RepID=UPI0034312CDF